jgi:hypothetical protein
LLCGAAPIAPYDDDPRSSSIGRDRTCGIGITLGRIR